MVVISGRTARERDAMLSDVARQNDALQAAHNEISRLAYEDPVTGLPNRKALTDHLDNCVARARRHNEIFAFLMLDLDRFKNVNDTLGHQAGDELLIHIAKQLRRSIRGDDFAARLGGDEFGVIFRDVIGPAHVAEVSDRIIQNVSQPVKLNDTLVHPNTSIGIALFPEDAASAYELMMRADLALHRAKDEGRGRFSVYDRFLADAANEADEIERDLRQALRNNELALHYQPKVDVSTGAPIGAEALLRWTHPLRGDVPPPKFLAIAEDRGLLLDVSRFVFNRLAADLHRFKAAAHAPISIALNIHPVDLKNPEFLFDQLATLRACGVERHDVIFEITEGCLLGRGSDAASMTLDQLDELGVPLSLDDFGTGHASLSHLKRLPVSELKVDREFVRNLCEDNKDRAIVSAAVEICRVMGLRCVAEGVETPAQLDALRQLGCHAAQGYLFAQALPPNSFEEWLVRQFETSLAAKG